MPDSRVTQEVVEVAASTPAESRVSQEVVELLLSRRPAESRVSQVAVETVEFPSTGKARTSQVVIEVLFVKRGRPIWQPSPLGQMQSHLKPLGV